jgi:hypothetical protein
MVSLAGKTICLTWWAGWARSGELAVLVPLDRRSHEQTDPQNLLHDRPESAQLRVGPPSLQES